ncbi:MAG TPA: LLM class F420-dependent oxidoreductase [Acidimicrobiia bacterium]|nr:LLM class F420-dependent oxidoreductase [Acidimicrobiia bacterium]
MKIGFNLPSINPTATSEFVVAAATRAEANGFASLWVGEHVVLFDEYESAYPYDESGKLFLRGEVGMLEPLQLLSHVAAVTRTIRLGTGVCLLPQRNPVYTAKDVSTLDWLSNGRVDFGIGLGWSREEFAALGVPWERRGARCDEYVQVLKRCWVDPVSEHHGEFYDLAPCRMYPKPVQQPHPPVHIGGESDAALRRVARSADGWHGFRLTPAEAAERIRRLGELLDAEGRRLDDVEVTIGTYLLPVDRAALEQYAAAGVDQVVVLDLAATVDDVHAALDRLAEELVEPAAKL